MPKVSQPVTLENLADRLMDLGTDHKIKVWAMIETPVAILNVREIAAVAHDRETRLSCLVIGTNDLAKEMRGAHRARPRAGAAAAGARRSWRRAPTASTSSTARSTISAMPKASRRNARRRATSASTARR